MFLHELLEFVHEFYELDFKNKVQKARIFHKHPLSIFAFLKHLNQKLSL